MKMKSDISHALRTAALAAVLGFPLLGMNAAAQPPQGRGWPVQEPDPANLYTVTAGDVSITVDAGFGARVRSLRLGDKEVLSTLRFPNAFGSTFWISPQVRWNWPPVPEHDRLPYVVSRNGEGNIVMTSSLSEKFPYRISKEFAPVPGKDAVRVRYTVTNEGGEPCSIAPWEITRVPGGGLIFFEAPVEGITPAGLMDFKPLYGVSWYSFDEKPQNRKVNADGRGWLAFSDGGAVLVKKFPDIAPEDPAPGEAEVQVYVNGGRTYIELENQGPYVTLAPGESLLYEVEWYVLPYEGENVPCEALLSLVRETVGQ